MAKMWMLGMAGMLSVGVLASCGTAPTALEVNQSAREQEAASGEVSEDSNVLRAQAVLRSAEAVFDGIEARSGDFTGFTTYQANFNSTRGDRYLKATFKYYRLAPDNNWYFVAGCGLTTPLTVAPNGSAVCRLTNRPKNQTLKVDILVRKEEGAVYSDRVGAYTLYGN